MIQSSCFTATSRLNCRPLTGFVLYFRFIKSVLTKWWLWWRWLGWPWWHFHSRLLIRWWCKKCVIRLHHTSHMCCIVWLWCMYFKFDGNMQWNKQAIWFTQDFITLCAWYKHTSHVFVDVYEVYCTQNLYTFFANLFLSIYIRQQVLMNLR